MEYTLEKLKVFKLSESLSDKIWNEVIKWKFFEKDTIGKQLVKAADSISANIAEGYGRHTYKDDSRFLYISRGSIQETKAWLRKCGSRNLIDPKLGSELFQQLEILLTKLNAYIKFVENGKRPRLPPPTNEDV